MRWRFVIPFLLSPSTATAYAAEATGAASPIGEAFCAAVEADAAILRCPGPAGVDAFILSGPGGTKQVSLGTAANGFTGIGGAARLGTTMEWRLEDGRPFAGIVRFRAPGEAGDGSLGDIFAILKTAEGERPGCLVALVDATVNPEGRDLARRIADERASRFACGTDAASFAGVSSDWARGLELQ